MRNKKLGFVFQDFLLLDGLTVRDNILLPRIIAGETGGDMEQAADRLCGIFGIGAIRNKYPAEISRRREAAHRRGPRPHQPPHAPAGRRSPPEIWIPAPPGR